MIGKMVLMPVVLSILLNACGKSDKKSDRVNEQPIPPDINVVDKPDGQKPKEISHSVVSDFRPKCMELADAYKANGSGQTLTVKYKDWMGNSRESLVLTTMSRPIQCSKDERGTGLTIERLDGSTFFNYFLAQTEEGKLRFDSIFISTCASVGIPAYIAKLKENNWIVNESVREAVERMYNEEFCPSLDAAIQARVGELSQPL